MGQDRPFKQIQCDGAVRIFPGADGLAGAWAQKGHGGGKAHGVGKKFVSAVEAPPPHPGDELPDIEVEGAGGGTEGLLLFEAAGADGTVPDNAELRPGGDTTARHTVAAWKDQFD